MLTSLGSCEHNTPIRSAPHPSPHPILQPDFSVPQTHCDGSLLLGLVLIPWPGHPLATCVNMCVSPRLPLRHPFFQKALPGLAPSLGVPAVTGASPLACLGCRTLSNLVLSVRPQLTGLLSITSCSPCRKSSHLAPRSPPSSSSLAALSEFSARVLPHLPAL